MPNWVDTDLTVTGSEEDLTAFSRYSAGPAGVPEEGETVTSLLSADKYLPYPDKFKHKALCPTCKDGYNEGGYEWVNKNWGTKWGFVEVSLVSTTRTRSVYHYRTAWSPATPVILAMSKKFPKLTFRMSGYDRGAAFQVHQTFRGGIITSEEVRGYRGGRGG